MTISAFPVLERGGSGLELTDPGMSLRFIKPLIHALTA